MTKPWYLWIISGLKYINLLRDDYNQHFGIFTPKI